MLRDYGVWRRSHSESQWSRTSYDVKARTDKEAESKVRRKFSGCGFSSMALVAVPHGQTPNG